MEQILGFLGAVPHFQSARRKDDSLTDRISHNFTVVLLIVFAVVVSAKQYVGEPINCWVPAHFSDNWEDYANSYCWIKNTYYLPFQNYIPFEHEADKRDMITYYQWVPLILLIQAVVFYIPCMVWRTFNARSGVDINNIVDTCKTFQMLEKAENKNKALDHLTKSMYRYVDSQHDYKTSMTFSIKNVLSKLCCSMCGRRKGNYLVTLYLCVKILYIGNIAAQFFLMNVFLGTTYHQYGMKFFEMFYTKTEDELVTPAFPRVTMCDFKIRVLGNVQRYTVQCVLPINLFNEMIYLFLWWWLVILGIASICSFFSWTWRIASATDRGRFIKKHLMLLDRISPRTDSTDPNDKPILIEFNECSEDFLKPLNPDSMKSPSGAETFTPESVEMEKDKYHDLKELVMNREGKWPLENNMIHLNHEDPRDKSLLDEILEIDPSDARKVFKVKGDQGTKISGKFMDKLHQDGIFVLRIVGNNTNSITITEVVCALWDRYCELYLHKYRYQ